MSMNQQQMVTETPCKPEQINPECNYCTGNASGNHKKNRHFVEFKLTKYKIYEFLHKVQNSSEQ